MKFRFSFLLALSAALVAATSGYYSVFGLSQLFAGASLAVIIMATSLEFAKIVSVSFLQRYWTKISNSLKLYLVFGVFVLVCITSAGIYGFLSNAYQKTAHRLELSEGELSVLNSKKKLFDENIKKNETIINTKSTRLNQLNNLRITQETRIDATVNIGEKNRTRKDINIATREIEKLNSEIDTLNFKNAVLSDSSNVYANKVIQFKTTNTVAGEIGPLKYLAELTGQPMDNVVNWFILLLIFVFDPLAIALVVATNKIVEIEDNGVQNQKSPLFNPIKRLVKKKNNLEPLEEPLEEPIEEPIEEPLEIKPSDIVFRPKKEPVIPTSNVEPQEIKETKEMTNRGFSKLIPKPLNNLIQRIGSNKFVKEDNYNKVFFKRK